MCSFILSIQKIRQETMKKSLGMECVVYFNANPVPVCNTPLNASLNALHSVSSSHRDLPWAFLRSLRGKRRGSENPLSRGEMVERKRKALFVQPRGGSEEP